jgi:hypothetical protein
MKRFICKHSDLTRDGWTYGDWTQYLYWRPDGDSQCVRTSRIELALAPTIIIPLLLFIFRRSIVTVVGPINIGGRRVFYRDNVESGTHNAGD